MSAYDDLMAYERDTQALGQVAGRLGWDQETVMLTMADYLKISGFSGQVITN